LRHWPKPLARRKIFYRHISRIEGIAWKCWLASLMNINSRCSAKRSIRNSESCEYQYRVRRAPSAESDDDQQAAAFSESQNSRPSASCRHRESAEIASSDLRHVESTAAPPFRSSKSAAAEIVKRFATGDVVWLDQQGSARNFGDCHEPHRRKSNTARVAKMKPAIFRCQCDLRRSAIKQCVGALCLPRIT